MFHEPIERNVSSILFLVAVIWVLYCLLKDTAKYHKAKGVSCFDIQTNITPILVDISLLMFVLSVFGDFISYKFSGFMLIITALFIANSPVFLFLIKIYLYKVGAVRNIGIEREDDNHRKEEDNHKFDADSAVSLWMLGETVFISLGILKYARWTLIHTLNFFAILLWIFFTSRIITRVISFYTFLIELISNDPKLKATAPSYTIFEQSLKIARTNYDRTRLISAFLFLSLMTYLGVTYFPSNTFTLKMNFLLCCTLLSLWLIPYFILQEILPVIPSDEQHAAIRDSFQKRLYAMKAIFTLFLLIETIIGYVLVRNNYINP